MRAVKEAESFFDKAMDGLSSTELHYSELCMLQEEFKTLMSRFIRLKYDQAVLIWSRT
jgi:hypothetical protein